MKNIFVNFLIPQSDAIMKYLQFEAQYLINFIPEGITKPSLTVEYKKRVLHY